MLESGTDETAKAEVSLIFCMYAGPLAYTFTNLAISVKEEQRIVLTLYGVSV